MSKYFTYFPTTQHDLTKRGQKVTLTNVLRRFKFDESLKTRINIFHEYNIQAGDRPDTIAYKYYGESAYGWIVLLFNEINDPIFEWPLFNEDFKEYIKGKYGSITTAQSTVHEYRKILTEKSTKYDGTIIPERYVVVDKSTYDSLSTLVRQSITKYDWELEEQERKRTIKILDKRYLNQIKNELKTILRNGI
jgi:hypothetical protein